MHWSKMLFGKLALKNFNMPYKVENNAIFFQFTVKKIYNRVTDSYRVTDYTDSEGRKIQSYIFFFPSRYSKHN